MIYRVLVEIALFLMYSFEFYFDFYGGLTYRKIVKIVWYILHDVRYFFGRVLGILDMRSLRYEFLSEIFIFSVIMGYSYA